MKRKVFIPIGRGGGGGGRGVPGYGSGFNKNNSWGSNFVFYENWQKEPFSKIISHCYHRHWYNPDVENPNLSFFDRQFIVQHPIPKIQITFHICCHCQQGVSPKG